MKRLIAFFKRLFGIKVGKGDSFRYEDLFWAYGGMDGRGAVQKAEIRDLKVDVAKKRMTYAWVSGGCEALGAKSTTDHERTYACIFYRNENTGQWVGGKFDEVSTSRTWRPLDNCAGYKGWRWQPFASAKRYAFLIIDRSGARRTNVIFS